MIHDDFKGKGIGSEVYNAFEAFVLNQSKTLRIDVVTDYDKFILTFWEKQGFEITDRIKIELERESITCSSHEKHL